jgi:SAM-dependent methyltransferase
MSAPTERFYDRVDAYVRSRPAYPVEVIDLLRRECGLGAGSVVADVGSGTGIFTRMLLDAGCTVFAVEPNASMRRAAEAVLSVEARFRSMAATAEQTGLPAESMQLITATQAFHWFDRILSRREFARILVPGGWVAILWNERFKDVDAFHSDYERLLQRWGTDYRNVDHARIGNEALQEFFAPHPFQTKSFPNEQTFDRIGLETRLLSSSYAPNLDSPDCAPMLRELEEVFARHERGGVIAMRYRTVVYYGRMR